MTSTHETDWDQGPFPAVLAPGQTSPGATDTKKPGDTKNNYRNEQLGHEQDTKGLQTAILEVLGARVRTAHDPCM